MLNRKSAAAGLMLAAVAMTAACSDAAPTEPGANDPEAQDLFRGAAQRSAPQSLDADFARIAAEVPGFGGVFYDENGALTVVIAPSGKAVPASAVAQALSRELPMLGARMSAQPVRMRQGQFDFLQLSSYRQRAAPVLGLAGVIFTDVDEVRNQVTIGVENADAMAAVKRTLALLQIPSAAAGVEIAEPVVPMQSLRDLNRPVAGGLQINFTGFVCTLGFNVRAPSRPAVQGFITNSHCTAVRGESTGTAYWQPSSAIAGSLIAHEVHDAPFVDCQYAGYRCRLSDAAGAQYVAGVEQAFGQIYRTTGAASLTIDAATPRWQIVEELPYPVVGQVLHKTGRTTGWSSGPVTQTCMDVGVSGSNPPIAMLCQDRVEAAVAGGDSGSPVFERIGSTNDVRLVGILWGGSANTFVLSSMENIRTENQGAVPWITYPGQTPPLP